MARHAGREPTLRFFKRVPGKVAQAIGGGEVLVPGALGRVWRVELRREHGGGGGEEEEVAFLGRGWAEFARAHGLGVGWFLVFRHEGRRVLSVKAFDNSLCLVEFCTPCPGLSLTDKNSLAFRRPQFIKILLSESSTKLRIPPKFVRDHMPDDSNYTSQTASIFSPLGKFWRVELRRAESHVFLARGWEAFLAAYGLSRRGNLLLFRYEGNLVFTVKAFGPSGWRAEYHRRHTAPSVHGAASEEEPWRVDSDTPQEKKQQPVVSSTGRKRKHESEGRAGKKKAAESSQTCVKKMKKAYPEKARHLLTKKLNAWAIEKYIALGRKVCESNGIPASCTVTLKTSAESKRSWKATFRTAVNYCYFKSGWKEFCRDNKVAVGDLCTIHVVDTTVWYISIRPSTLHT